MVYDMTQSVWIDIFALNHKDVGLIFPKCLNYY